MWAAGPASVVFLVLFFYGPNGEYPKTQMKPHTFGQFCVMLVAGASLAGAKFVDRLSKYTITQDMSAFAFQIIEAVRNKMDLWLVVIVFGEPASVWMVVAFAVSVVGAVVEQAASSDEFRQRLFACWWRCLGAVGLSSRHSTSAGAGGGSGGTQGEHGADGQDADVQGGGGQRARLLGPTV